MTRPTLTLAAALVAALATAPVRAADPVVIGEMNSYTRLPAFTLPYRDGWQLALEEINAAGGVLDGRPLAVVSRDDGGKPADAVTVLRELVNREDATIVFGTLLSNVGLAVADQADRLGVVFLASEPISDRLVWEDGNPFTFRLRSGTYLQAAMLAEEAAQLPATRWATVAPNYEYGQSAVAAFKALLSAKRPDVEFVAEQWPALFKIDAGATVQALALAEPDAIFNVTFGADMAAMIREGQLRGLFDGREVFSLLSGEPEWIDPLGAEAPEGWVVTGYPWYDLDSPAHTTFRAAYEAKTGEYPRFGSVIGYVSLYAIAAAIDKAGTADAEAVAEAFRGLQIDTPLGPIAFRASDQQSTMGAFVGRLTVRDGMPRMVDWRYGDGTDYLPSDAEAARRRAAP